jgi:hypothetical protein
MEELDVPVNSIYISGESKTYTEPHGWNLVKIGKYWYHIDCLWGEFLLADSEWPASDRKIFIINDRYGKTKRLYNYPKRRVDNLNIEADNNVEKDLNYYVW